jgi:hypothetical protein
MNAKQRQELINQNSEKIKGYKKDRNCIKFNITNTKSHEMKKAEVCYEALKQGFTFLTEAEFKEGGRADVYLPEVDMVIEVLCSETKERFESKNYPVKKIIPIRINDEVKI